MQACICQAHITIRSSVKEFRGASQLVICQHIQSGCRPDLRAGIHSHKVCANSWGTCSHASSTNSLVFLDKTRQFRQSQFSFLDSLPANHAGSLLVCATIIRLGTIIQPYRTPGTCRTVWSRDKLENSDKKMVGTDAYAEIMPGQFVADFQAKHASICMQSTWYLTLRNP